jgi:hypothetical protein
MDGENVVAATMDPSATCGTAHRDEMDMNDKRKRYHDNALQQSKEAFSTHEIVLSEPGRWRLQRRDKAGRLESTFCAEIISLWGGELYVGGDIDFVIFGYYSDHQDPESKVRWMGRCGDISYYVHQKASIGTGHNLVDVYDEEVAKADLAQLLMDLGEEGQDIVKLRERMAEWEEWGFPESPEALYHDLYEHIPDTVQDRGNIGEVMAYRVYYAHAALARLCDLLDETTSSQPNDSMEGA